MTAPRRWRPILLALGIVGASLLGSGFWIPIKAELAQYLMQRAWAAARSGGGMPRPWPWADTWPVARLSGAAVQPTIVLAGASGRSLAFGPGLVEGTVLPGEPGVSVLAAHRDTHFRSLQRVQLGDAFEIERPDGVVHVFRVTSIDIVDARHASLRLDADEPTLVLVTCWPFDAAIPGGPERFVATARLDPKEGP